MVSCSPAISARMGQLVRLLATNHLGELTATRDALQRTLRGIGADLNDLAELIETATATDRKKRELTNSQNPPTSAAPDHRVLAERILANHDHELTDWDWEFLANIRQWYRPLSAKQRAKLSEIAERVLGFYPA